VMRRLRRARRSAVSTSMMIRLFVEALYILVAMTTVNNEFGQEGRRKRDSTGKILRNVREAKEDRESKSRTSVSTCRQFIVLHRP